MSMSRLYVSYCPPAYSFSSTFSPVLRLFHSKIVSLDLRYVSELLPEHLLDVNWRILRDLRLPSDATFAISPLLQAVQILLHKHSSVSLRSLCLSPGVREQYDLLQRYGVGANGDLYSVQVSPSLRSVRLRLRVDDLHVPACVSSLTLILPVLSTHATAVPVNINLPSDLISRLTDLTVNYPFSLSTARLLTSLSSLSCLVQSATSLSSFPLSHPRL
jgi:hypothetical protein